jgi:hypothetical protein
MCRQKLPTSKRAQVMDRKGGMGKGVEGGTKTSHFVPRKTISCWTISFSVLQILDRLGPIGLGKRPCDRKLLIKCNINSFCFDGNANEMALPSIASSNDRLDVPRNIHNAMNSTENSFNSKKMCTVSYVDRFSFATQRPGAGTDPKFARPWLCERRRELSQTVTLSHVSVVSLRVEACLFQLHTQTMHYTLLSPWSGYSGELAG